MSIIDISKAKYIELDIKLFQKIDVSINGSPDYPLMAKSIKSLGNHVELILEPWKE